VIDQAQHFAALGPAGGGGTTGDTAQSFREGLDATERECMRPANQRLVILIHCVSVFTLAQESAKRTKQWYEESDKGRR
jgi:GINS complex subunit 3